MDHVSKNASEEARLLRLARRRVRTKNGFYIHALVYVLVNLGLFAINAATGHGHWAVFPLLGWGLGLAIHGIVTFASLQAGGLRERMVDNEMARLRRNSPGRA
jgi:hypothetical protein